MTRRWVPLIAAAACGASLIAAPAADAAFPARSATAASSSPTRGGGILPTLGKLGSTKMRLVVPKVPCGAKASDTTITVGMFGSTTTNGHTHPWLVGVRVWCTDGQRRAEADFGGFPKHGGLRVYPGDVVVLSQSGASEFSVEDKTTHQGTGGGTATPVATKVSPEVLFGGRIVGHFPHVVMVSVTNALVHGKPLGHKKFVGRDQVNKNGKIVAEGGPVSRNGRLFPISFDDQG